VQKESRNLAAFFVRLYFEELLVKLTQQGLAA
jgi:hypothetical protein